MESVGRGELNEHLDGPRRLNDLLLPYLWAADETALQRPPLAVGQKRQRLFLAQVQALCGAACNQLATAAGGRVWRGAERSRLSKCAFAGRDDGFGAGGAGGATGRAHVHETRVQRVVAAGAAPHPAKEARGMGGRPVAPPPPPRARPTEPL